MKAAGLFSGIGGLELGLEAAGFQSTLLCDADPAAQRVLERRFPGCGSHPDVTTLSSLPGGTDVLAAGFPCQDLSQAGRSAGADGARSGLVSEVFRLVRKSRPKTVLVENVPFMLLRQSGEAMRRIAAAFEDEGYRWAWRVVDANAFGLPQRRERVFFVASIEIDPAAALLPEEADFQRPATDLARYAHGFYWTEGRNGLGWAVDAIPTMKAGSTVGIVSPPAVLRLDGSLVKPHIGDAERLQGFEENWTQPAEEVAKPWSRWRLVGNAVAPPVAEWAARRIALAPQGLQGVEAVPFPERGRLPKAAFFDGRHRYGSIASTDPVSVRPTHLEDFLRHPGAPLSRRAVNGFLSRTRQACVRFPPGFIERVERFAASLH